MGTGPLALGFLPKQPKTGPGNTARELEAVLSDPQEVSKKVLIRFSKVLIRFNKVLIRSNRVYKI